MGILARNGLKIKLDEFLNNVQRFAWLGLNSKPRQEAHDDHRCKNRIKRRN